MSPAIRVVAHRWFDLPIHFDLGGVLSELQRRFGRNVCPHRWFVDDDLALAQRPHLFVH